MKPDHFFRLNKPCLPGSRCTRIFTCHNDENVLAAIKNLSYHFCNLNRGGD